jgi:hypothetical protein
MGSPISDNLKLNKATLLDTVEAGSFFTYVLAGVNGLKKVRLADYPIHGILGKIPAKRR